jgi:hypothetical protein
MYLAAVVAVLTLLQPAQQDPGGLLGSLAAPMQGKSMRVSSTNRVGPDGKRSHDGVPVSDDQEHSNSDNYRVGPGQTHVVMDVKGPGMITHIWFTFLGPEKQDWAPQGSATHQDMLLRIYWDGSKKPGVEAPLGDFFAGCFGKRAEVISLPVVVTRGSAYNCFWRMPFHKSCRMEIVNQSDKSVNLLYYNIDWLKLDTLPRDTPYFYAQYKQEYPVEQGHDYTVLETQGKGHYVGTVLAVRTRSPMWFGEGDEKMYLDGDTTPTIQGTGTEDYFLSAWGLLKLNTPYYGVPYFDQWGIVGGHTSAYRWHLNDPVVFQKGIKVAFEHWGWISPDENPKGLTNSWNERQDDYSSVAFWYQTGEPTFTARAPDGPARHLPNIDRVIAYGKDFTDSAYHGSGEATKQELDIYDGGEHELYMPKSKDGAWLEIPLEVTKREPLVLLLNMTTSSDFGTYQAYLDGVKLGGPMDFYSADTDNREFHLMDFWPEVGKHVLRLECVGKNYLSSGFYCGIESARLRERRPRVTQYGYDKDKDWKKHPVLYQ